MTDRPQTTPIRHATDEELRAQRRSWVASEAAWGSDADEAAYRAAFDRGDKEEMVRLDAEGEARKQRVIARMPGDGSVTDRSALASRLRWRAGIAQRASKDSRTHGSDDMADALRREAADLIKAAEIIEGVRQ